MGIWKKVLFIIVGIAAMFIFIGIASTLLPKIPSGSIKISGEKSYVISMLISHIYDCFEKYKGKRGSVICNFITINSTEHISSSEIVDKIDSRKIDKSKVKVDELGFSGEIVIRYESQNIYVEKVEYERVGS